MSALPKAAHLWRRTSYAARANLHDIDPYLASQFVYLRFQYTTCDAAGQNMVGRATFAARSWILDHYQGVEHFYWSRTSRPISRPRRSASCARAASA